MPVVGIEIENWHKATGCPYPLPIDHSWLGCNHDRFGMLKSIYKDTEFLFRNIPLQGRTIEL